MTTPENLPQNKRYLYLFPVLVVAIVLGLVLLDLHKDPFPQAGHQVGKPAPTFSLPLVMPTPAGITQISSADLKGHYTVINFFASWCKYCRREHETLKELGALQEKRHFRLWGVNVHDTKEAVAKWFDEVGNPYEKLGFDPKAAGAQLWGVIGTPHLFIVDPHGVIIYQVSGSLTRERLERDVLPLLPAPSHAP